MLDEWSVQTLSTPFNIFKNKENVESILNESLKHFQQGFKIFFTLSTMLKFPVQTPPTFGSTTVLNAY